MSEARRLSRRRSPALAAVVALSLSACTSSGRPPLFNATPAGWNRAVRELGLDPETVICPVQATPEMRRAAHLYGGTGSDLDRLSMLHTALLDRNDFAFEYEKVVTFTAAEAFVARRGNCVSFANLLIAFARAVGVQLQAGLVVSRGSAEKVDDLIVTYSHMVAVYPSAKSYSIYDFYADRGSVSGNLRLIDDLEIAAIALSNRGVAALREGDLASARDLLEKAVRLGPKLPDMHANLGIVYWRQGEVDTALATFLRGLELDPHQAGLLHNLAALYLQLGRVAEARAALAAANLGEASAYLLVVKGDLELAGGDSKSALRSYRRAHSRDPSIVPPLLGIARAERSLGRPEEARRALEKASRLSPDNEQVQELLESL